MTKQPLLWRHLAKTLACVALLGCSNPIEHGGDAEGCSSSRADSHDAGDDGGSDAGSCDRFSCKYGCCLNGTCLLDTNSAACNAGIACGICASCDGGVCGPWPGCKLNAVEPPGTDGHLVDFGSQAVGTTTTLWVQLINAGSASCEVSRLGLSASLDTAVFSIATLPSLASGAVSIPPGSAIQVDATFKPGALRSYLPSANTFTLETSDPSATECSAIPDPGCKQFALKGTGR